MSILSDDQLLADDEEKVKEARAEYDQLDDEALYDLYNNLTDVGAARFMIHIYGGAVELNLCSCIETLDILRRDVRKRNNLDVCTELLAFAREMSCLSRLEAMLTLGKAYQPQSSKYRELLWSRVREVQRRKRLVIGSDQSR